MAKYSNDLPSVSPFNARVLRLLSYVASGDIKSAKRTNVRQRTRKSDYNYYHRQMSRGKLTRNDLLVYQNEGTKYQKYLAGRLLNE